MPNGSCLCGKITFTLKGDVSNMSHCHCSMCRKIHGALFATYLEAADVAYTSGQDSIHHYTSSKGFVRAFCDNCGSVLPEKSTVAGSTAHYVAAGLLDDDPGIRPQSHIFCESKSDAYVIHDNLPQMTHYGDGDLSRVIDSPVPEPVAEHVRGGCQCGAVSFEYSGVPRLMMHCHCSRCRKVKGAAHATNAFVPKDQFRWTKGQENITNYDHAPAERFGNAFCTQCGSSVPRESGNSAMLNVPVGSLDSAPGIDAKGHIFTASKAPWFDISDDLPQWDEMPSE